MYTLYEPLSPDVAAVPLMRADRPAAATAGRPRTSDFTSRPRLRSSRLKEVRPSAVSVAPGQSARRRPLRRGALWSCSTGDPEAPRMTEVFLGPVTARRACRRRSTRRWRLPGRRRLPPPWSRFGSSRGERAPREPGSQAAAGPVLAEFVPSPANGTAPARGRCHRSGSAPGGGEVPVEQRGCGVVNGDTRLTSLQSKPPVGLLGTPAPEHESFHGALRLGRERCERRPAPASLSPPAARDTMSVEHATRPDRPAQAQATVARRPCDRSTPLMGLSTLGRQPTSAVALRWRPHRVPVPPSAPPNNAR
jgi:hypothetical protein